MRKTKYFSAIKAYSILVSVLLFSLLASLLTGCRKETIHTNERLSIVTTIFPEYDWVCQILGDKQADADITFLLDSGVDLHSFQPTADDIIKIARCDLFIYVGGESDAWAADALKEATNPDMTVLNLMEILGEHVKEEELVEGMEAEAETDDPHAEADEAEEGPEYDEHIWLSLNNAEVLIKAIEEAIAAKDPENSEYYAAQMTDYLSKVEALDDAYRTAVAESKRQTILFGDRFPFRYLVDDYGLDYYAAFAGCSAESEASFETVAFLSGKVDELDLPVILTLEGTDHRIAETIASTAKSADVDILSMDSMQSTTITDAEAGASYLSIMENNLAVLQKALR